VFPAEGSARDFCAAYPLGSANVVVAVAADGGYKGLINVPEAHGRTANDDDDGPIGAMASLPATVLHPDDDIGAALDAFGSAQADTLVVVARGTGKPLGLLGEAYAARRYAQETDRAMRGVLGGG
jgi:chloride channel protein, CIC family